jgi:hypothetical protein
MVEKQIRENEIRFFIEGIPDVSRLHGDGPTERGIFLLHSRRDEIDQIEKGDLGFLFRSRKSAKSLEEERPISGSDLDDLLGWLGQGCDSLCEKIGISHDAIETLQIAS